MTYRNASRIAQRLGSEDDLVRSIVDGDRRRQVGGLGPQERSYRCRLSMVLEKPICPG